MTPTINEDLMPPREMVELAKQCFGREHDDEVYTPPEAYALAKALQDSESEEDDTQVEPSYNARELTTAIARNREIVERLGGKGFVPTNGQMMTARELSQALRG